jgi:hypothetical protein
MIILSLLTLIYFLPTIVATNRGHHFSGIFALNLLFGWTGIGWVAMMLWALLSYPKYLVVDAAQYYPHAAWRR